MDALFLIVLKLLAVAALVLLNGFFVAAEFALVKIRATQLDPLSHACCRACTHTPKRCDSVRPPSCTRSIGTLRPSRERQSSSTLA